MIPPMTTPRRFRPTVQNPLNAQVDIDSLSATCDLDAVRQGRDGAVGPAWAAVVREVLVELFGEVGFAINVIPTEVVGYFFSG